jgi:hypothetical protein
VVFERNTFPQEEIVKKQILHLQAAKNPHVFTKKVHCAAKVTLRAATLKPWANQTSILTKM